MIKLIDAVYVFLIFMLMVILELCYQKLSGLSKNKKPDEQPAEDLDENAAGKIDALSGAGGTTAVRLLVFGLFSIYFVMKVAGLLNLT